MAGALALGLAGFVGPARAQRSLGKLQIEASRPGEAAAEEAESEAIGFLTVVPASAPSARAASVAELVEREVGLRVRRAGGLGSFTAVSLRGSDASEVAVFLDGVPLNRASSAAVDLSQIPAAAIERVEIYRGLPPPELSGQGLGGAINIVTRKGARPPALRGSLGLGSFGTRSATFGYGFGGRRLSVDASLGYHGSRGDFTYYDDNGTIRTNDDRVGRRRNNDFNQLAVDVSLSGAAGERGRFELSAHGFVKDQGVPGRGSLGAETELAHLTVGRLLLAGALEGRGLAGGADLRLAGHLLFEHNGWNNRTGEPVGSFRAARTDGQSLVGGVEARLRTSPSTRELATASVSLSVERFIPWDLLAPEGTPPSSTRLRAALVLTDDVRLLGDRLAIVPTLRFEGLSSQLGRALITIGPQAAGVDRVQGFLAPQLGVRARLAEALVVKASVGRSLRVPTLFELFGDGATLLPRPSLLPETATAADLGLRLEGRHRAIEGFLEADGFVRDVSDYIAIVPSGRALSAQNVGDRRFLGVEATGRVRLLEQLSLSGSYAFTHALTSREDGLPDSEGRALPNVPMHKLDGRAELSLGPLSLSYEVAWTSAVWLNPQNVSGQAIPGRTLHALGVRLGPLGGVPIRFSVDVRNLADLRVLDRALGGERTGQSVPYPLVDFFDYPLPGRAVYLTAAFSPE